MLRRITEILWYTKFKPGLLGNHVYLLIMLIFHHNARANLPFKRKLYFSVTSNFIWLMNTKTCIFTHFIHKMNTKSSIFTSGSSHKWNVSFCVHEWNKIWSYWKKQIFCFFYAFIYNNKVSTCFSTFISENKHFSSHFASIWSCSACLWVYYWAKTVLHLENEPKQHLKQ